MRPAEVLPLGVEKCLLGNEIAAQQAEVVEPVVVMPQTSKKPLVPPGTSNSVCR